MCMLSVLVWGWRRGSHNCVQVWYVATSLTTTMEYKLDSVLFNRFTSSIHFNVDLNVHPNIPK